MQLVSESKCNTKKSQCINWNSIFVHKPFGDKVYSIFCCLLLQASTLAAQVSTPRAGISIHQFILFESKHSIMQGAVHHAYPVCCLSTQVFKFEILLCRINAIRLWNLIVECAPPPWINSHQAMTRPCSALAAPLGRLGGIGMRATTVASLASKLCFLLCCSIVRVYFPQLGNDFPSSEATLFIRIH